MVPLDQYADKGMPLGDLLLAKRCAALTGMLADDSLKKSGSVSREYAKWSGASEHFQSAVARLIVGTDESEVFAGLYVKQLARMYEGQAKLVSHDQKSCLAAYQP
jgi:hypothetical protein